MGAHKAPQVPQKSALQGRGIPMVEPPHVPAFAELKTAEVQIPSQRSSPRTFPKTNAKQCLKLKTEPLTPQLPLRKKAPPSSGFYFKINSRTIIHESQY